MAKPKDSGSSTKKPVVVAKKPAVVEDKKPVVVAKKPVVVAKKPTVVVDKAPTVVKPTGKATSAAGTRADAAKKPTVVSKPSMVAGSNKDFGVVKKQPAPQSRTVSAINAGPTSRVTSGTKEKAIFSLIPKDTSQLDRPTSRVTSGAKEQDLLSRMRGETPSGVTRDEAAQDGGNDTGGGAGGGSGSGSGTGTSKVDLDPFTQQLQAILTGGTFANPYNSLQSELEGIYNTGQTDLTTNRTNQLAGLKTLYDNAQTGLTTDRDAQLAALKTLYGDAQTGLTTDRTNQLAELSKLYGGAQTNLDARNKTGLENLQSGYDTARTSLGDLNTQAGKTINTSMDSLKAALEAQVNPYANLEAQSVSPTAELSSFLQGQNVGNQQAQDYAQVLNAQNAGASGAFNNVANILRSIAGANQQGALSDVAVQRDASTRQLASQNQAYGNQLTQGLLADKLRMGQTYDQNTFDISKALLGETSNVNQNYNQNAFNYSKGLLGDTSGVNQAYNQNAFNYNQGLFNDTSGVDQNYYTNKNALNQNLIQSRQGILTDKTQQQQSLMTLLMNAIAKGGKPTKGDLF